MAFIWSGMGKILGCVFVVILIIYGIVHTCVGYMGIEHQIGHGWAIAVFIPAWFFRLSLPFTVGVFFEAM